MQIKIAEFATGLRAASFTEALADRLIESSTVQPRWTNKRLPPPRIQVLVAETDVEAAKAVLAAFNKPAAPAPTCHWFLNCTNPATTTVKHPILGDVPTCARCAARAAGQEVR